MFNNVDCKSLINNTALLKHDKCFIEQRLVGANFSRRNQFNCASVTWKYSRFNCHTFILNSGIPLITQAIISTKCTLQNAVLFAISCLYKVLFIDQTKPYSILILLDFLIKKFKQIQTNPKERGKCILYTWSIYLIVFFIYFQLMKWIN